MVFDSYFRYVARPSFLGDRRQRERRSMPVTGTFGSPFHSWTLRDGNVRAGHPAVTGLYPIHPLPVGEEGEGQKQIPPNLFLSACHEKYNAANERHRAHDGRQRNIVSLLASSVNRSDIDDLFPSRVRKPAPRKTEQTKHYQNDAKRFVHGSPLSQRPH
jgi:hypothetical protein